MQDDTPSATSMPFLYPGSYPYPIRRVKIAPPTEDDLKAFTEDTVDELRTEYADLPRLEPIRITTIKPGGLL